MRRLIRVYTACHSSNRFSDTSIVAVDLCRLYFCFHWDHWSQSGYLENRIPFKPVLGEGLGACTAMQTILLYIWRIHQNRVSDFRCFVCSLFLDHGSESGYLENRIPLQPVLREGAYTAMQTTLLYKSKTCLYNFDPLKPHFYIVKLGFTGVYIIFLISAQKHRLWVLVWTASQSRNMFWAEIWKISEQKYEKYQNFYLKIFIFLVAKFSIYLNGRVFVMDWTKPSLRSSLFCVFFGFKGNLPFGFLFYLTSAGIKCRVACSSFLKATFLQSILVISTSLISKTACREMKTGPCFNMEI